MDHQYIPTNNIHLHVVESGPSGGPLVILLHGFPEYWYGWRKQIPYLAEAGFRVWAPDQRGYNCSDKPVDKNDYALDILGEDVLGLINASGRDKVYLVGHDWGGAVAWWVAAQYPERIEKLVILNVPHGSVMNNHLRGNFAQMRKSWYIFFFQIPWLPEAMIRLGNWYLVVNSLKKSSRPGTFSDEDFDNYRRAWSRPNAFRSMLNWYRAILQHPPKSAPPRQIEVPTQLIWGLQDKFFEPDLAQYSIDYCSSGQLEVIEEATHWVQHEEPKRVNELMNAFFHRGEIQ